MLELYYNYFKKFCDTEKYEELEVDTGSLYLALSEEKLEDIILPEKRNEWKQYVREIAQIASLRMPQTTSSQERVVLLTRSIIRCNQNCLKKNSRVPNCCACVAKPFVATIKRVTSTNSVARDSIKELWKTEEMGPCQSIEKCSRRQSTLPQPTADFEQWNIALQPTNRQKGIILLLPKTSSRGRWNTY